MLHCVLTATIALCYTERFYASQGRGYRTTAKCTPTGARTYTLPRHTQRVNILPRPCTINKYFPAIRHQQTSPTMHRRSPTPLRHPALPKIFRRTCKQGCLDNGGRLYSRDMKAPQTTAKTPAAVPVAFDESLVARCFPYKFRRIGDPYGYLDDVGLEAILEFIYKGNLLIDVAEATDVPLMKLRKWVEDRGYFQQVEDAETQSADGYLAFARHALKNAPTEFELRRAKELMKHAQFMAENKNKQTYGGGVHKGKSAPVKYEFVIGNPVDAPKIVDAVIDAESRRVAKEAADNTPTTVSIGEMFPRLTQAQRDTEPVMVMARPRKPTADAPDVGPFFDDPTDQENQRLPEHYAKVGAINSL